VLGDVPHSDRIRNALKAQALDQPLKNGCCVVVAGRANQTAPAEVSPKVVKVRCRPREAARGVNNLDRVGQVGIAISIHFGVQDENSPLLPQINETSLRWASVSPSMYRCVVSIDRWPASSCTSRNEPPA
jgi:hypothetical protein